MFQAKHTEIMTFGGMGHAQQYHVERPLREVLILRTPPISQHMIINVLAEKMLDPPKSGLTCCAPLVEGTSMLNYAMAPRRDRGERRMR